MATLCKTLIIRNKLGLHARAATKLAQLTQRFDAKIAVEQDGQRVDAASVMCLMLLAGKQGKEFDPAFAAKMKRGDYGRLDEKDTEQRGFTLDGKVL